MKLSSALPPLLALAGSASAFSPSGPSALNQARSGSVALSAEPSEDRRAFLSSAFGAAGAAALITAAAAAPRPPPALAAQQYQQQWLTEPTQEFLDNEARAAEFKRQQLAVKKEFNDLLGHIVTVSKTEDELRTDLEELTKLIARSGGLPAGLKKEDMYKQIRSVKARGFWPTSVEYAYQELKLEVAFQQSPNQDKELGRP